MEHAEKVARRKALLGMRIIGGMKLLTGIVLLLLGLGVRHLLHPGVHEGLHAFFLNTPLDAESHLFHDAVEKLFAIPEEKLHGLGIGLFCYSGLHLLEGIGLILGQTWAECLVVVNTGLFVPLEVREIIAHPDWIHVTILLINLIIMGYFVMRLLKQHRKNRALRAAEKNAAPA